MAATICFLGLILSSFPYPKFRPNKYRLQQEISIPHRFRIPGPGILNRGGIDTDISTYTLQTDIATYRLNWPRGRLGKRNLVEIDTSRSWMQGIFIFVKLPSMSPPPACSVGHVSSSIASDGRLPGTGDGLQSGAFIRGS